jgi:PPK2 family polyphosphate:nucleotide phosphotransferase
MSKKDQLLIPKIGKKVKLSDYDPGYHGAYERESARAEELELETRLFDLQERLYAESKQALLIVLQAMDAGGKDSTIKKVFDCVNPQGVRVSSFKVPTPEERSHDFLWRVHQRVPPAGYIGIFNRSHYEDVLVVRVDNLVPKKVWQARYDHINNFERLLTDGGVRVLKFYLHIDKDEQKERFQERLDNPEKHWKFASGDLDKRQQWGDYMAAYEDVLTRCNTAYAPWHIIPANRKWYRNLVITRAIVETLEAMKPQYPEPEAGLDQIVIPD